MKYIEIFREVQVAISYLERVFGRVNRRASWYVLYLFAVLKNVCWKGRACFREEGELDQGETSYSTETTPWEG